MNEKKLLIFFRMFFVLHPFSSQIHTTQTEQQETTVTKRNINPVELVALARDGNDAYARNGSTVAVHEFLIVNNEYLRIGLSDFLRAD